MSVLDDIRKAHAMEIAAVVACFLGAIGPGFLMIAAYYPDSLKDLDVVKLTVLSLAITIPLLALNVTLFHMNESKGRGPVGMAHLAIGAMISGIILYVPLLIKLFCPISLAWFAGIGLGLQLLFTAFAVLSAVKGGSVE